MMLADGGLPWVFPISNRYPNNPWSQRLVKIPLIETGRNIPNPRPRPNPPGEMTAPRLKPTFAALLVAFFSGASCMHTEETAEAEFSFSFQGDAERWTAGFADLPADFDPSIYELDSGYRRLPEGLEGNGLYIQGHNRSDDLFMFFKRQVGGLKANAEYTAVLSLELATNVPEGLVGIGGSPGESVYVKAGASTDEPLAPEDDNGYFRMNIDKGNQSNGGRSMSVLGHVAHPDVTGKEYRIKSLDNSGSPVSVTADGAGRLWLIVGTDSGFEGLSAFYYARIACTLTPGGTPGPEGSLLGVDQTRTDRGQDQGFSTSRRPGAVAGAG